MWAIYLPIVIHSASWCFGSNAAKKLMFILIYTELPACVENGFRSRSGLCVPIIFRPHSEKLFFVYCRVLFWWEHNNCNNLSHDRCVPLSLPSECFLELIFSRWSQTEDNRNSCYTMGHTYRPGPETVLDIIPQRHFNSWKNIYVQAFFKVQVKGISILQFFKVTVLTKKSHIKTCLCVRAVLNREAEIGVLLGSVLPTVQHHVARFL